MKIIPFNPPNEIDQEYIKHFFEALNKKEVRACLLAWLDNDGLIVIDKQGTVFNQCGLLTFLEREITSQIEVKP